MEDMLYGGVGGAGAFRAAFRCRARDDDSELSAPAGAARAGAWLFEENQRAPGGAGLPVRAGTIVDAASSRPSSTDEPGGGAGSGDASDEEGHEWHFGMKAHIGVDAETGLEHGVRATPANTHDLREAGALLHGGERRVWAGRGLPGDREVGGHEAVRCSGMWR